MGLLQKIRCWLGQHRRSRSRARMDERRNWRSRCSGCGVPMQWIAAENRWVATPAAAHPPRDRQLIA